MLVYSESRSSPTLEETLDNLNGIFECSNESLVEVLPQNKLPFIIINPLTDIISYKL